MGICVVSHRFHSGTSPQTLHRNGPGNIAKPIGLCQRHVLELPRRTGPPRLRSPRLRSWSKIGICQMQWDCNPTRGSVAPKNALRYCMRPHHFACHPSVTGFWPSSEQPIGTVCGSLQHSVYFAFDASLARQRGCEASCRRAIIRPSSRFLGFVRYSQDRSPAGANNLVWIRFLTMWIERSVALLNVDSRRACYLPLTYIKMACLCPSSAGMKFTARTQTSEESNL